MREDGGEKIEDSRKSNPSCIFHPRSSRDFGVCIQRPGWLALRLCEGRGFLEHSPRPSLRSGTCYPRMRRLLIRSPWPRKADLHREKRKNSGAKTALDAAGELCHIPGSSLSPQSLMKSRDQPCLVPRAEMRGACVYATRCYHSLVIRGVDRCFGVRVDATPERF
jgi:hypothetical protein